MQRQRRTRVLFVNDDPSVLAQTKAAALGNARDWDFDFATSGNEALSLIEFQGPFDAIVADMRMPLMDGPTLLTIVRDKFPETIRIIVSDFRDLSGSLRCLPVAHQFFIWPIEMEKVCDAIERCVELHVRLRDDSLRAMLGEIDTLPSPPLSVVELNRAISNPDSTVDDIALVIARDPAMTTKLLQLVNSAFFGLSHRITDARHAVAYLGLETVRNLLTAVELVRSFTPPSLELMHAVEEIHMHSIAVAERARTLMTHRHGVHDAFAAGMMHEVGLLAVIACAPEHFYALKDQIARGNKTIDQCEHDVLGASHAQLGAYVLNLWGLPYSLVESVARSHDADQLADRTMSPVHAVFIAEQLTNVIGSPCSWEQGRIPHHEYLIDLGVDDEVQQLMLRTSVIR